MELSDGTVIPHFLSVSSSADDKPASWFTFNDTSLRVGRIIRGYSPNNPASTNKQIAEWDVAVNFADSSGSQTEIVYYKVRVASLFGGVADYLRWTPRLDVNGIALSSYVLVLCINGNQRQAYIIGGIPHPESTAIDANIDGRVYVDFNFNGLGVRINNNGSFQVEQRGATDFDGSVINPIGTSSLFFNDSGDINLSCFDKNQKVTGSILLERATKHLSIFSDNSLYIDTNTYFVLTTPNIRINEFGPDQQSFLRATTYRDEQETMHNKIMPLLQSLSALLTTAGAQLAVAAGFHAIPIVGASLGASGVAGAGAALTAAAPLIQQIQTAIQGFELNGLGKTGYLSPVHTFADAIK